MPRRPSHRPTVRFAQLPIPQPAWGAATGNVPLAAGALAVALQRSPVGAKVTIDVVRPAVTDALGDTLLAEALAADEPAALGLSLYLWNVERSLHLARAVKERSPRTKVLLGGPEVCEDSALLADRAGFDVAVQGEAEEVLPELVARLVHGDGGDGGDGDDARALPAFVSPRAAAFELTRFPSPYVAGLVPVEPARSTYVETVRGCRSHCTFCFYPRSSAVLRALDVDASAALIADLKGRGAREIVFLDPTFNHRPDFDGLLRALGEVNRDGALRFFAELRAEGLTDRQADQLAACGFHRVEIGLQSVNRRALTRTRRGGDPALVADAARRLKARGIAVVVDLIVGLPEDTPSDVLAGADFLMDHGVAEDAQVFRLSVLPGTAMRASAAADGLEYDRVPPYYVRRTSWMEEQELVDTLFAAEERLDRRVDEFPRPFLSDGADGAAAVPDVFQLDVDRADERAFAAAARPGAQHVALWIAGQDLWKRRDAVERAVSRRIAVDPFATLDVVLAPAGPFPLNLLELLAARFAAAPQSYASRVISHRGEDGQRRIAVLEPESAFDADYLAHLSACVPVFRRMTMRQALDVAERLGDDLPGARIDCTDDASFEPAFRALAERADPEAVAFADRALETRWVDEVLRFRRG